MHEVVQPPCRAEWGEGAGWQSRPGLVSSVEYNAAWAVLSIAGKVDAESAEEFRHLVDTALARRRNVVIDLTAAPRVDPGIVELMDDLGHLVARFGGQLTVVRSGPSCV